MTPDTREALAKLTKVAAALAQRQPLAAFWDLEDATHIGHRQFARTYDKADEDTRLLAVALADAIDAVRAALSSLEADSTDTADAGACNRSGG